MENLNKTPEEIQQEYNITPEEFELIKSKLLKVTDDENEIFTICISLTNQGHIDVFVDGVFKNTDIESVSQLLHLLNDGQLSKTIGQAIYSYAKNNLDKAKLCKRLIQKWQEKENEPYVSAFQPIET